MPDRDRQLDAAERGFTDAVAEALEDTADEFAAAVADATELVAARFSVGRIAGMWGSRVSGLVRRLLHISETAAQAAAEDTGTDLPDGWDDLPGRYDDGRPLPDGIGQYAETSEDLLIAVGSRLAEAARRELAAGLDADEGIEQLRDRLTAAFAREGAHLGDAREKQIAQTEAGRAWNTATLAAARAVQGPGAPIVKQWLTRGDSRVRKDHHQARGQLRLLDEPFTVGGVPMDAPGDPSAPADQVIGCRCRLAVSPRGRSAALHSQLLQRAGVLESEENLMEVTAADGHTGAMVALMPTREDAGRLALDSPGAEPADELHLTLFYLGEGADWSPDQRAELIAGVRSRIAELTGPLAGRAFGANHWNADGPDPCWVWAVGDDPDRPAGAPALETVRAAVTAALEDRHGPEMPAQHSPWQPHVCAAYSRSPSLLTSMNDRLGPVRFDRIRLAFAGEYTDIPFAPEQEAVMPDAEQATTARPWSTPGDAALAFEDTETGDGRVFRPGALYWTGPGPWPLQYADEMLMGHQGAELAGAIQTVAREGARITGTGVLYPGLAAGADALMVLEEKGPLGVSVDLDDVSVEFVDRTEGEDDDEDVIMLLASLQTASLMRMSDGSWSLTAGSTGEWTAAGTSLSRTSHAAQLVTGPGGRVTAAAVRQALGGLSTLTAAAGDPDNPDEGTVVHRESSGDLLMRVTRARFRGATLVAMPAYDQARIVLDGQESGGTAAEAAEEDVRADGGPTPTQQRVIGFVTTSPTPVGARHVARSLRMSMASARRHLAAAAKAGFIVRLSRGLYVGPSSGAELEASVSGDTGLPVHEDRDRAWDADEAQQNMLAWATGEDGTVAPGRLGAGHLWRDDTADPATTAAYRLPFADVVNGELRIIAAGVFAAGSALQDGTADLPEEDQEPVRARAAELYERLAEAYDDESIRPPWRSDDEDEDLVASAWTAMSDAEPMPAAWFREPTAEELPPGSGGVHYKDGRVYGWVAQAGEPHAGYPGRQLTIESLGDLDLSHFLRARFTLDDGSLVRAGAMTMNVGHHRDGAECETAVCQFDDTRTVSAIVTVGQNERGLWFSGAAAPWLSEWDRAVFRACQPSYHMKQAPGGRWQLRAVLTVPVPGHSSPLLASTVAERSNLALAASAAASAAGVLDRPDASGHAADAPAAPEGQGASDQPGQRPDSEPGHGVRVVLPSPTAAGDLTAALAANPTFLDTLLAALDARREQRVSAARDEADRLAASVINPARELVAAVQEGAA